ncbi:MAG: hypothetical protein ACRC6V_05815 [Bacteroidales bacterium]
MARRRWRPKKEDELKGTPYDSLLEKRLHEGKLKDCGFHNKELMVEYSVPHSYEPDFTFEKDGKMFLIETKGRFQDSAEARKYLFIREALDEEKFELVFVWQKKGTRFPFARKRLDGSYATQEEYASKHGFRHWTQDEFELELL